MLRNATARETPTAPQAMVTGNGHGSLIWALPRPLSVACGRSRAPAVAPGDIGLLITASGRSTAPLRQEPDWRPSYSLLVWMTLDAAEALDATEHGGAGGGHCGLSRARSVDPPLDQGNQIDDN